MSGNVYGKGKLDYADMSYSANLMGVGTATVRNMNVEYYIPRTVYVTDIDLAETLRLEPEDTETLVATVLPDNADLKTVTWESDNEAVATVDKDGKVTAIAEGTATITATSDMVEEVVAECTVSVETFVTGVTLDNETLALTVGGSDGTLTSTVAPEDATDDSVVWTSSDEEVVIVENGVVTAIGVGTAIITVTTVDGGFTAECEVTVTE